MKSFARYVAAVVILVSFSSPVLVANDKHPALPSRVLSAKTVYVDNQTTAAELENTVYTELSKIPNPGFRCGLMSAKQIT
jgi:hypothetical protein